MLSAQRQETFVARLSALLRLGKRTSARISGPKASDETEDSECSPKVGRGDYPEKWSHHDIGFLVRVTEHFIVHIDKKGQIDWETTPEYDQEAKLRTQNLTVELSELSGDISVCEASMLQGYSVEIRHHYLKLLGEARAHVILGEVSPARKMIRAARKYYRERSEEVSRDWYLSAGIISAGLYLITGILAWLTRERMSDLLGPTGFMVLLAACSGAAGAMFSIIARSGELNFKASAGRRIHKLEASSRVTIGSISGVVVYLAFKSGLVLGSLAQGEKTAPLLLLVSLAAGAIERIATSIISKFDDSSKEAPATQITNTEREDE